MSTKLVLLDSTGATVVKYVYDAWGNHIVTDYTEFGLGQINPIRYRSYYYDTETGLYYLKSRYYDPQTGRFISMDDISYLDPETIGGTNLFAYCNDNPVMLADPTGNSAVVVGLIIGAIVGALLGFGTVAYNDYQDDKQIFNGSVEWYEYVGGTLTGSILGAGVGATIGLGGQAIIGGLISVGKTLVNDVVLSVVTDSNQFSSWQEYAVSFIFGGLTRYGAKNPGKVSKALSKLPEWIVVPTVNQLIKSVFERKSFDKEELFTRIILNGMFELLKFDFKNSVS